MPGLNDVRRWLEERKVEVLTFAEETPTAVTAARAVGCSPAEIAKSILFLIGGQAVLVVTSGDMKIKSGLLKKAAGLTGKVRLPAAEEVLDRTGYTPGGVCPFLLPADLPVFLDESLWRFATVYPAAGDDHSAVPLSPARLAELVSGRRAEICTPREN
jgi:prolyl-tRNA editing enzyme YbaK/EbsC (Cys-tRNA(Pro) deacylase)